MQNGFRDIAETIGEILEGAYQFLSIWAAMDERVEGRLASEEWNNLVMLAGQRFHKNNLPAKLEHLKRNFHFSISEDTVLQIKSINAVRNCLVHRNGIIGKVEIQQTMTFEC